jgi:probable rRNA maturation factor
MADGGPSRKPVASPGVTLDVEIVRHGDAWGGEVTDATLGQAARAALAAAGSLPQATYQVTLVLTDDGEMRTLNRNWRGKNAPTNVLSFPAGDPGAQDFLGDVVLAYETACQEAREQDIALRDHVSHLVVHGVLHLLGFDHLEDDAAKRMEALEHTALATLGIGDPYAEENGTCPAEVTP